MFNLLIAICILILLIKRIKLVSLQIKEVKQRMKNKQ